MQPQDHSHIHWPEQQEESIRLKNTVETVVGATTSSITTTVAPPPSPPPFL